MKVKALVNFKDNKENIRRKAGDEFIVSKERFAEINEVAPKYKLEAIVEEIKDKAKKEDK